MRELRLTTIERRIYLFPVPVVPERKYLVFCSSQSEAEAIILGVKSERLTHPDLISEDFIFLTTHTDKNTKIYVLNPAKA